MDNIHCFSSGAADPFGNQIARLCRYQLVGFDNAHPVKQVSGQSGNCGFTGTGVAAEDHMVAHVFLVDQACNLHTIEVTELLFYSFQTYQFVHLTQNAFNRLGQQVYLGYAGGIQDPAILLLTEIQAVDLANQLTHKVLSPLFRNGVYVGKIVF